MQQDCTHVVTYKNQGKPEKAYYKNLQDAKDGAEFLKFQGAKSIKIKEL